jgi:hypothetical protein
MKPIVKKTIAILILLFAVMFIARFLAGFFYEFGRTDDQSRSRENFSWSSFSDIKYDKVVSSNIRQLSSGVLTSIDANVNLLEVFAKEAQLRSTTEKFESDEGKTRSVINQYGALIRIEQKEGLTPYRKLQLVIRVSESKFDGLVRDLQKVGKQEYFQVLKEDKSEEAKKLLVEKKSLEEYLKSLIALRKSAGKVEEFLALEGKIQEIRRKVEELDAGIGKFAGTESFNNVSFALGENRPFFVDPNQYPVGARLMDALLWTVGYYFLFVFLAGAAGLIVWSGYIVFRRG